MNQASCDALPLDGGDFPRGDGLVLPVDPTAHAAQPKVRTKRPRPTFEDGSLTRVFKFPSKTYPRSTYYVTGTEIIIRIKKARKKWKLVIPKKRVVSYRTNRWFATPRWVEIELTFTQASRLGFVAPRSPSKRSTGDTAEEHAAHQSLAEGGGTVAGDVTSGVEPEITLADDAILELEPDSDAPTLLVSTKATAAETQAVYASVTESDCADTEDIAPEVQPECTRAGEGILGFTEDVDEPESLRCTAGIPGDFHVASQASDDGVFTSTAGYASACAADSGSGLHHLAATSSVACPEPPLSPIGRPVLSIGSDHPGGRRITALSAFPEIHRESEKPARKINVSFLLTLMLMAAGSSVAWVTLSDFSAKGTIGGSHSVRFEPATSSTQDIVTGSIDKVAAPHTPELDPHTNSEIHALSAPAKTEQLELSAPKVPTAAFEPTGSRQESTNAVALMKHENEPAPQGRATAEQAASALPSTVVYSPTQPLDLAVANQQCRELASAARSIEIHFDYASASLHHASLSSLDDFARRLRSCASGKVTIEGHSDSDGDADRNKAVSVRRAQSVREHLVNAGARSDQLAIIGFGKSRPSVPNDSSANKYKNRRAVLVVELSR